MSVNFDLYLFVHVLNFMSWVFPEQVDRFLLSFQADQDPGLNVFHQKSRGGSRYWRVWWLCPRPWISLATPKILSLDWLFVLSGKMCVKCATWLGLSCNRLLAFFYPGRCINLQCDFYHCVLMDKWAPVQLVPLIDPDILRNWHKPNWHSRVNIEQSSGVFKQHSVWVILFLCVCWMCQQSVFAEDLVVTLWPGSIFRPLSILCCDVA